MSQKPYLPKDWDLDREMAGYMSALKVREVNPQNYDRIVDFWKKLIESYCRHEKKCIISYDELKSSFKRGNQLPAPLSTVLEVLYNNQVVVPVNEIPSPRQGWLTWGTSLLAKSSWLMRVSIDIQKTQLIHLPSLKTQANELLNFYKTQYEMVDCPEVVEYNELKTRCGNTVCDPSCFDYVLDELMRQGEVAETIAETGEKLLKFKDQTSKGPAKFTKVDASVHELRKMIARVDAEVRKIEMKVKRFDQEARDAVHRKDKVAALSALRKKKRIEREMQDKDVQYQRLVSMLEQLATSKQNREILDAYKTANSAYKDALERQGLSVEKVDETMESIHEAMQDVNDIDEALRLGFSSIPMPANHIDDETLEAELNSIMAEEFKTADTVVTKKHEPELPAFPKVPEDNFAERLKRLREREIFHE